MMAMPSTLLPMVLHRTVESHTAPCALAALGRGDRTPCAGCVHWACSGHNQPAWSAKGHQLGPCSWTSAQGATVSLDGSVA
jgi:hypothetical protein